MLNGILFGLKKFFSEIGSGDMIILFSSLILSVTAISGVGFLSDRFQRSIQQQASIVLGAEMVFRSGAPIEDRYIQTAELMEIKTGISPDLIRKVARLFANTKKGIIFWGMGISQHVHGTDNARCLISLALMTGNVGRRGAGLHPLRGQNNVQGASDAGLIPMMYPDYQLVDNE